MKLRYILTSFLASAALFLTGCVSENEVTTLDSFLSNSTYVTIPVGSTSSVLNFSTSDSWTALVKTSYTYKKDVNGKSKEFTVDTLIVPGTVATVRGAEVSSWASLEPVSGSAGENTVTFTASGETESVRSTEVYFLVGDDKQIVMVTQAAPVVDAQYMSVAEAIQVADGKTVYVEGYVTSIYNMHYGNWYITDNNGNLLQVYGTRNPKGKTTTSTGDDNLGTGENQWNLAEGDAVKIHGGITTYNGNKELVDVYVDELVKSLLTVEPTAFLLNASDTTVQAKIIVKGGEFSFKSDCDWISLAEYTPNALKDTSLVTIAVAANPGSLERKGKIFLSAATETDASTVGIAITQKGNAVVATVSEAVALEDGVSFFTTDALVTALTTKGFVASDGTTGMYVYLGSSSDIVPVMGDRVSFVGNKTTYNGVAEATGITSYTVSSSGNTIVYPASNDITSTLDSYTNTVGEFVAVSGKLEKTDAGYFNVAVDGASRLVRIDHPTSDFDLESFVGKNITLRGYFNGISAYDDVNYVNVIITSIAEGGAVTFNYKKATTVSSGKKYLIAAKNGDNYEVMKTLAQSEISKTFGYVKAYETTAEEDVIALESEDFAFTFTASGTGFTIVNSEDKYVYQNGTYKTYNEGTEMNDNCIWTVSAESDGTFTITSPGGYTMYFDTGYGCYGCYNDTKDTYVKPCLFEYEGASVAESGEKYEAITSLDDLTSGASYLIAATNGEKVEVMKTLAQSEISKTFGYVKAFETTKEAGVVKMDTADFGFTITKTDKGYTIVNSEGRYVYQSGTYKTYNEGTEVSDECYWTIAAESDGTFTITSPAGYSMYFDSGYNSYGCYNDTKDTYIKPCLYKKK